MMTPLCVAASCGNTDAARKCVELCADISITADGHSSMHDANALHYAATANAKELCEYFVGPCKMDVNAQTKEKDTPLLLTRSPAVAELLLSHGAKVTQLVTPNGNNLVAYSNGVPCVELLKVYLAYGGKKIVNTYVGNVNTSPLFKLCYAARNKQLPNENR